MSNNNMELYFDTKFYFNDDDDCKVNITSYGTFDEEVAKKIVKIVEEFINSDIKGNNILVYGSWVLKVNDEEFLGTRSSLNSEVPSIRIENDRSYVAISLWSDVYRDILDIIIEYQESKDGKEEKVNSLIVDEWQKEIIDNYKESLKPEIKDLDETFVINDDDFWGDSSDNN